MLLSHDLTPVTEATLNRVRVKFGAESVVASTVAA